MPMTVGGAMSVTDLNKLLATLGAQVQDLRPFFYWLDTQVSELFREQFLSRGQTFGTPWPALSPVTPKVRIAQRMGSARARKAAAGAPNADMPLYDSGGLFGSFVNPLDPSAVRSITATDYVRGSQYAPDGVPVASLMQSGFPSKYMPVFNKAGDVRFVKRKTPVNVPARPIVPDELPMPVINAWVGQLTSWIEQGDLT